MKGFIKKILREGLFYENMESDIRLPFIENGEHNYTVIATDKENDDEHYLILNTSLLKLSNIRYELSFGLYVINKSLDKSSNYFYTREEVNKYLPNQLKGKVTPLVNEMSINLIKRIQPKSIEMQTTEKLEGDSLKRYDKIIDLLVNELNYKLINDYEKDGIHYWVFNVKNENNINEVILDEDSMLTYEIVPITDKIKRIEESLKKHNFLDSLKENIK
jgi:hypothetical protein